MEMDRGKLLKAYKERAGGTGINLMYRREGRIQHRKNKESELFNKRLANFHKNNHNKLPVPPELVPKITSMPPPKLIKCRSNSVTNAKQNDSTLKNSHLLNHSENSKTTKVIYVDPFAKPKQRNISTAKIGQERLDASDKLNSLNATIKAIKKAKEDGGPLKRRKSVPKDDGSICADKKLGRNLLLSTSSHDATKGYESMTGDFKNGMQWRVHLRDSDVTNVVPPPQVLKREFPVLHPVLTIKMAQKLNHELRASDMGKAPKQGQEDLKKYFDERLFLTLPTKY